MRYLICLSSSKHLHVHIRWTVSQSNAFSRLFEIKNAAKMENESVYGSQALVLADTLAVIYQNLKLLSASLIQNVLHYVLLPSSVSLSHR